MKKKPLNLSINDNLIDSARKHGINLSAFLEIKLQEHLALIEEKQSFYHNNNNNVVSREIKRPGRNSNPSPKLDRLG